MAPTPHSRQRSWRDGTAQSVGLMRTTRPPFVDDDAVGEQAHRRNRRAGADLDHHLHGLHGEIMGAKNISAQFSAAGVPVRGKRWSRNRIHRILTEAAYTGTYLFKQLNVRAGAAKRREHWVPTSVETIVPAEVFEAIASLRRERSPDVTPPRVVTSPTLLTGLLRCANCTSASTAKAATGEAGVGTCARPSRPGAIGGRRIHNRMR